MSRRRERRGVVMRSRAKAEDSTYSQPLKSVSRVPELRESSRITCDKKFDCNLLIVPLPESLVESRAEKNSKSPKSENILYCVCASSDLISPFGEGFATLSDAAFRKAFRKGSRTVTTASPLPAASLACLPSSMNPLLTPAFEQRGLVAQFERNVCVPKTYVRRCVSCAHSSHHFAWGWKS